MKMSTIIAIAGALAGLSAGRCEAESVWGTGSSLAEVIGIDLQAHASDHQLTSYETNEVCLLLGYFRGFAESAAIASHYDATALPFCLPDNITNDAIERVVYKFLSENQDKLGLQGGALMVAAFTKEYPNPSFSPPGGKAKGDKGAVPP